LATGDIADDIGQRSVVAGGFEDHAVDMAIEVQIRIIDPEGPAYLERCRSQSLAD
jgi:hypothetical protein